MRSETGLMQIGFAVVIASILAIGSLVSQRSALNRSSKLIQVVNRLEGYYEAELAIWHNYNRNKSGFTPPVGVPVNAMGAYAISFSNDATSGLTQTASAYSAVSYSDGQPLNLARTRQFDSGNTVYRRRDAGSISYSPPTNASYCGYANFRASKSTFATCLREPACFDSSFGTNGVVKVHIGAAANFGMDVRFQSDGKVVFFGFDDDGSNPKSIIARLNANGTLDTGFATSGSYRACIGTSCADSFLFHGMIQADGKSMGIGHNRYTYSGEGVDAIIGARLTTTGALDTTLSGTGRLIFNPAPGGETYDEFAWAGIIEQPDGKLVIGGLWDTDNGDSPNNQYDSALFRLSSSGSLDSSFAAGGKLMVDLAGGLRDDRFRGMTLQPDGKIIAVGNVENGGMTRAQVVRVNADGTFDTSFNSTGKLTFTVGTLVDTLWSVAVQADGKILVSGSTRIVDTLYWFIARLMPSGTLDTSYNSTGYIVLTALHAKVNDLSIDDKRKTEAAYRVKVLSDGRALLVGTAYNGSNYDIALAVVKTDGTLDTTFNATGYMLIPVGTLDDYGFGVDLLPDNTAVVLGNTAKSGGGSDFVAVKLKPSSCP